MTTSPTPTSDTGAAALLPPDDLSHWRLRLDEDGIAWLDADRAGESANALGEAVFAELDRVMEWAERACGQSPDAGAATAPADGDGPSADGHERGARTLTGLVIGSAKPASFILGADIREFDGFDSAEAVSERIREGHRVFARLENLECPTAAAVHGYCLGGGLELALCCDWILALNVPATRFGFPEVKLGIFPGLGGTTRVTERLGGLKGLELCLTAKMLRAPAAKRLGLIDELVDEFGSLHWSARRAILKGRRKRGPGKATALINAGPARSALGRVLARKTAEKADPAHYPAPFEMIDLWVEHRDNRRRMFEGEAVRVGELMVSDTARHLRRIFFLTERMKTLGDDGGRPVRRVHVVGAGVMGGDIAAWCVLQGLEVTLQDRALEYIEPAIERATSLFKKRLKGRAAVTAALSRLVPDVDGDGIPRADLVIEAISENLEAKRSLYAAIEPRLADGALLATNTSALPLDELSKELAVPARLIGLHFFNPVAKMPLVEVVHGAATDADSVARGCAFATAINRFPLPVKSSPGFLVNRVLAPYLMEAFTLLLEGVERDTIDAAAIRWGMPMGPIELADTVGLDVCRHVAETLVSGDVAAQAALLDERIAAGELGKKSGKGFYTWEKGRSDRTPEDVDSPYGDQLADRLLKPFLEECLAVSSEGLVEDDDLLDAGIVFGTGFAPFRGGPLHYLASLRGDRSDDAASSVESGAIAADGARPNASSASASASPSQDRP